MPDAGNSTSRFGEQSGVERYGLPPHVFVAFDGAYAVWLDIRRDRYFAVERARTKQEGTLASLVRSGLLVYLHECPDAKPAMPVRPSTYTDQIRLPVLAPAPRIRLHHVRNIILAWIIGAAALKLRGLDVVLARMRGRGNAVHHDQRSLQELISAFALLRPFFFALRGRCLLSSVVLSEFLARYGVHSQCVFGVRARPFAAHCWLEQGTRVLNDSVERVRAFTPILRV